MPALRFAVIGCGFWSNYQVPAWLKTGGVKPVALYNRTVFKAQELARKYEVPAVYHDVSDLLNNEQLDFVDIITDVDTHGIFTKMAADKGVRVICQKPMSYSYESARQMLLDCKQAGQSLFIHENFRWQAPIRKVKELLSGNIIGEPFKARVSFCSGFDVYANQPALKELDHFILTDIGSHILDVCRFLFGEAETLYCQTKTINRQIKGEDVANVFMKMESGLHCYAEMSYASVLKQESFPQTLLLIEGTAGSIELTHGYSIIVTTKKESGIIHAAPKHYSWADKDYDLVHSSIVDCNINLLGGLQGKSTAETTGEDNIKTVQLVWASYQSAKENKVINLNDFT